MKFISTAFVLLAFTHATVLAAPNGENNENQQCNSAVAKTVTVTHTQNPVTKTVTVNAGSTSAASSSNNNNNNNNNAGTKGGNTGAKGGNTGTKGGSNTGAKGSSTGAKGSNTSNNNNNAAAEQSSLQLDPSTIGPNLASNGLGNGSEAGQVASLTSTNNFINFCTGKTITNGLQTASGSCNPVPMGDIPSKQDMLSVKFSAPKNFATIKANTSFTVSMNVVGFITGNFVNPNTNYFAAPQQLKGGKIVGHSHVVIQQIASLQDNSPLDPTVFTFFQGLNAAAQNGVLSTTIAKGLPSGNFRIASINTAANHQPALVPVAQHGSLDDIIYITVVDNAVAASSAAAASASPVTSGAASVANGKSGSTAAAGTAKNNGAAATTGAQAGKGVASSAPATASVAAKTGGKVRRAFFGSHA